MLRLYTILAICLLFGTVGTSQGDFQAGAAIVDVSPPRFPVLINGGMRSRTADKLKTNVYARSLVLKDVSTELAIIVVDSCMMSRELLDEAKKKAEAETGIATDHILVSATHTHTAPASMGCLGTSADESYAPFLIEKLVESIVKAKANLEPAQVGWGVTDASNYNALRRWIRRSDKPADDPFGNPTVHANMHAARNLDDVTGESGPKDPDLSLVSIQSVAGRPIAVLANYSMHYYGDSPVSYDYFGLYCEGLKDAIANKENDSLDPPFVGMMSHGCSGDIWRRDYRRQEWPYSEQATIEFYAKALVDLTVETLKSVEYDPDVTIAMAEERLNMKYRVPDKQRLEWARRIVDAMGDRIPENTTEVYAREQVMLHEKQGTEVVVQALRIGDIAIATTPTETYALTGLKVKLQSPLEKTMVFDLTNGGDGYIPPPEQHLLGGYNTWAARSAGLEVQAEPRIVQSCLRLLERVSNNPVRNYQQSRGPLAHAIMSLKPYAWWRLDEFGGPMAFDSAPDQRNANYEPRVAYFLEGPHSDAFCKAGEVNRCVHFAGNRLVTGIGGARKSFSVSMWIWNGMPTDARAVSGWFLSNDRDGGVSDSGIHLGVGGTKNTDRLILSVPKRSEKPESLAVGKRKTGRWAWRHVALVKDDSLITVYLDGEPEIEARVDHPFETAPTLYIGGRSDNADNWEGRIDEVALFDRVLTANEVGKLAGN